MVAWEICPSRPPTIYEEQYQMIQQIEEKTKRIFFMLLSASHLLNFDFTSFGKDYS